MNNLPKHLGGHMGINHVDFGALSYIKKNYNIESIIDIGCGLGEMKFICDNLNISYIGIDGDYTANRKHKDIIIHDYTSGKSSLTNFFDLAWSTEFLEHVEEKYIDNFMADFTRCKYAMVTHALPGKRGYHHVNCKEKKYWIDIFYSYGFNLDEKETILIRDNSNMTREFIRNTGLFFVRNN